MLNNRVVTFCNSNTSISDAQFGFKKGCSTADAIFSLHTFIEHYLDNDKRLYVGFIDLKKASILFIETRYGLNCLIQVFNEKCLKL